MQEAAIQSFPDRINDLNSEFQAQQQLYRQVKASCNTLERELRRIEKDIVTKQEAQQATMDTLEEARQQFQETAEVTFPVLSLQELSMKVTLGSGVN